MSAVLLAMSLNSSCLLVAEHSKLMLRSPSRHSFSYRESSLAFKSACSDHLGFSWLYLYKKVDH